MSKMRNILIFGRSPTAGGQYHWVSEFSPRWCQKFLSYITGGYPLILSFETAKLINQVGYLRLAGKVP